MLTDLADVVRTSGLTVTEVAGWQTRGYQGRSLTAVRGAVAHHTAGPAMGTYPSLGTVRDGTSATPGPLAHLGLARDGSVLVIAAGLANHAGKGSGYGLPANGANPYMLGIEAESTGSVAGDWTAAQLDAYPRLLAALARGYGFGADMVIGHAEWAPGRKVDPRGWPGGMDGLRASVAAILGGGTLAAPAPAPSTPQVASPGVPAPAYPLPTGWYFGPKSGPKTSVSGFYSHREDLRRWQQRMKDRGWVINPDGLYGPQTEKIARLFQTEKGLLVDGLIGPVTWAAAWTAPVTAA